MVFQCVCVCEFKNMDQCSDLIVYLKTRPFSSLSYEEKCAVKERRPKPHLNIVQRDKHQSRNFHSQWYEQYQWLTASETTGTMHCYVCLLFGGDSKDWSETGIACIKNFHRKARKHQISKKHILNWERYHLLGQNKIERALLSSLKHNEMVERNRRYLGRLIQVICFLGKQELAFRGHNESDLPENKGNYLEILDMLAQEEQFVREKLESSSGFKGTSSDIQNELVECAILAVKETIQKELDLAEFVSVQADITLDGACKSQMSIIFRYCVNDSVQERFIGFFDVSKDKTAEGLSTVILNVMKDSKVDKKLICQTYDGALMMAGSDGGVHATIKQQCPNAMFIHCYAHRLNLVLLYGAKKIKKVRLFVYDLTAFHTFFSKSSKRSELLREAGFKLPQTSTTCWNYHSNATATITAHFQELRRAISHIIDNDEDWDGDSYNGAVDLLRILEDSTFIFLLCLYQKIFVYIDHLHSVLQTKCTSNINNCNQEVKLAVINVKSLRSQETVEECIKDTKALNSQARSESFMTLKALTFEIIDTIVTQMESRFEDLENFNFIELLDEKQFPAYKSVFPSLKLSAVIKKHPYFDSEQLQNELINVYSDQTKHLPAGLLLKYFLNNGLEKIYQETVRLIRLILTFPVSTPSSERSMSALKRVKTFLRNAMSDSRLSNLSTLAIEKSLLNSLSRDSSFKEHIINIFAERKTGRPEFIYRNYKNNVGNRSTNTVHKGNSTSNAQDLLRKKQKINEEWRLAKRKTISDSRHKRSGKPQPITVVSVEGMNMPETASTIEDQKSEATSAVDPLGNIQIKEEIEDNDGFTFEEHFEDVFLRPIKTEVKDELVYNDPDDLLEGTVLDSSSCDTFEDGNLKKKPKLEEDLYKPTHSSTSLTPEKTVQKFIENLDVPGPCEKPYVCKICFKTFPTFNDLKKHATLHERNTMKFHCKKCNLKFATRIKLKDHLNRHARQEKFSPTTAASTSHTCRVCKRGYSVLNILNKHKRLHMRANSSASERIVTKYKQYQRDINPLVELKNGKPFKCRYCLKSYRLVSELVRHAYIHPYPQRYAYPDVCMVKTTVSADSEDGSILRSILTE